MVKTRRDADPSLLIVTTRVVVALLHDLL